MQSPDRTDDPPTPPLLLPAEFVRYAVALEVSELAWGHLNGRLTAEDTVELAFLRRCDLGPPAEDFARIHALGADAPELDAVCRELVEDDARDRRIWDHLVLAHHAPDDADRRQLAAGRQEFLLDRAASGRGMNWQDSSALMGTDRPEEVDAALDRGEELARVAIIGLALTHPDAAAILPRVARVIETALETADDELLYPGTLALAHTARLHGTVDRRCMELLRRCPRGNVADDDVATFVARRRLPWWLRRYHLRKRLRWVLWEKWIP
ncbi:hypothetical protein AB0D04_14220 [Streptomyces sp. NPDC048483]|uniref:hypothetical protein n=1 Tax=Streptomyces sp. NPDC048483 TaxID=3154927 RepID=UPI0034121AC5